MSTSRHHFVLFALFLFTSCYKQDDYDPLALQPGDVITELAAVPNVLSANNVAVSTITAVLPEGAREGVDVVFRTGKGVFVDNGTNSITVKSKAVQNGNGLVRVVATAALRNGLTAGAFNVTATLDGYEVQTALSSVDNPPTGIDILVPALVLSNDTTSEMELFAKLSAASGTVSLGHIVTMVAYDQALVPRGTFRVVENSSNAEGKCRFVFSLAPDLSFTGPLTFKATSAESTGTYEDSVTIQIY
jgi:hypothetical protein